MEEKKGEPVIKGKRKAFRRPGGKGGGPSEARRHREGRKKGHYHDLLVCSDERRLWISPLQIYVNPKEHQRVGDVLFDVTKP